MSAPVLVIDDDIDFSRLLARRFERAGLEVRCFSTAMEARAFLEEGGPIAAICIDLSLPDESGLSLSAFIRSDPSHARVPLLFMTGRPGLDEEAHALEIGADAFFEKPFRINALLACLQMLLHDRPALPSEVKG